MLRLVIFSLLYLEKNTTGKIGFKVKNYLLGITFIGSKYNDPYLVTPEEIAPIHFEVQTPPRKYLFVARLCLGHLSFSTNFFYISRYLLTFCDHMHA
jgi:hypothetical protein